MSPTPTPPVRRPDLAIQPRRRARSLLVLLVGALVGAAALAGSPGRADASAALAPQVYADQLLAMLNQERRAAGLPELAEASPAVRVASLRVLDMAANNYFSHTSPTGVTWTDLMRREGVPFGW